VGEYYILKDKKAIPCDMMTWAVMFGDLNNRIVQKTKVFKDVEVSTVFLGNNHNFGPEGPPLIFETMVFGGELDEHQERYSTWDEAWDEHWKLVGTIMNGLLLKIGIQVMIKPIMKRNGKGIKYYRLGVGSCLEYHMRLISWFETIYGTVPRIFIEHGDHYMVCAEGDLIDIVQKLNDLTMVYSYQKWIKYYYKKGKQWLEKLVS